MTEKEICKTIFMDGDLDCFPVDMDALMKVMMTFLMILNLIFLKKDGHY